MKVKFKFYPSKEGVGVSITIKREGEGISVEELSSALEGWRIVAQTNTTGSELWDEIVFTISSPDWAKADRLVQEAVRTLSHLKQRWEEKIGSIRFLSKKWEGEIEI